MKRAHLLGSFALCAALAGGCRTACSDTHPGEVAHVVLVWLKQPGDAATKGRLVATARDLAERIPGIRMLSVGDALPSERDVVDDSFDLGLVMHFVDAAALAAYEVHPVHTAAVRDVLAPAAAKLVVYDVALR